MRMAETISSIHTEHNNMATSLPSLAHQLILFGSPGTGKSHRVDSDLKPRLRDPVAIKTVFHPEYTYGDFMGKLLPLTNAAGRVEYRYYCGHFLKALAQALAFEACGVERDVLLVIDEINRGNSAAIFGTAFQLLDRDKEGWSSYPVDISEMEQCAILRLMGTEQVTRGSGANTVVTWQMKGRDFTGFPTNGQIKLPPNLYIIGTMNTSDESIYYMDSAFKRRWAWEYVPVEGAQLVMDGTMTEIEWKAFVGKLNSFIRSQAAHIRKVEDKQIGFYFIRAKEGQISNTEIQNKLMFFLWDTVFARDKRPLNELMNQQFVTFGEFANMATEFVQAVNRRS